VPYTFEFTPGVSNHLKPGEMHDHLNPIFLHLGQDDYEPDLMLPSDPQNPTTCTYKSVRMVIPNKNHYFFFSLNSEPVTAQDQMNERNMHQPINVRKSFGSS
jgi:hypothetical protein